jgi:eukaryotic translation initiation factor 2C
MQHAESGMLADIEAMSLGLPTECYKFDNYAKKRFGTLGRPTQLVSNYFRMRVQPKQLYHYNIEITPTENKPADQGDQPKKVVKRKRIPKEVNFIVFDQLWSTNRDVFKSEPVFDGEKNIYSHTLLNFNSYEKNFLVPIVEAGDRKSVFKVRITTPDDSHIVDLAKIKESTSTDFKVSETQALDIILKNGPRRFKLSIGMNLFLRTADLRRLDEARQAQIRTYLGENKEMAFGFYQSARMTEEGLMLNLDRAAIVFNKGGSLISVIEKLLSEAHSNYRETVQIKVTSSYRLDQYDRKMLETEIKGLKVQINHIPYKPKFTVHRFSQEPIDRVFFEETKADGAKVRTSVFDYFNRTYAAWLQTSRIVLNANLPAVQIGRDRPKYFPMEVCEVLEDQHSTKKLKAKLQAEMTRRAGQQNPQQRFQEIAANLKSVMQDSQQNGKAYLRDFGVEIDPNFVKVNARILQQPNLQYRDQGLDPGNAGAWDMGRSRVKFLTSPDLGKVFFSLIFFNQF